MGNLNFTSEQFEVLYRLVDVLDEISLDTVKDLTGLYDDECYDLIQHYLNNRKRVNKNIDLDSSPIEDLSRLEYIGGNLLCSYSLINDLSNLESIDGTLNLKNTPIGDLSKLKFVGKNFLISGTNIKNLPNLTEINGHLDIRGLKGNLNIPKLSKINGQVFMYEQDGDKINLGDIEIKDGIHYIENPNVLKEEIETNERHKKWFDNYFEKNDFIGIEDDEELLSKTKRILDLTGLDVEEIIYYVINHIKSHYKSWDLIELISKLIVELYGNVQYIVFYNLLKELNLVDDMVYYYGDVKKIGDKFYLEASSYQELGEIFDDNRVEAILNDDYLEYFHFDPKIDEIWDNLNDESIKIIRENISKTFNEIEYDGVTYSNVDFENKIDDELLGEMIGNLDELNDLKIDLENFYIDAYNQAYESESFSIIDNEIEDFFGNKLKWIKDNFGVYNLVIDLSDFSRTLADYTHEQIYEYGHTYYANIIELIQVYDNIAVNLPEYPSGNEELFNEIIKDNL